MSAESNDLPFPGAYPTNRDFVEQLDAWGFTRRKEEGTQLVLRGPHGGTLRVLRSLLGRADRKKMDKAAHLAGVTVEQFWAGPGHEPTGAEDTTSNGQSGQRDHVTSLVLSVHTQEDRPLGFEQVVKLAGGPITREQVRTASSQLCREGNLDRIRLGVYQWSDGGRSGRQPEIEPSEPAVPQQRQEMQHTRGHPYAAELFEQLFPSGVHMTAELLADFERWTELTEKLATYAKAS